MSDELIQIARSVSPEVLRTARGMGLVDAFGDAVGPPVDRLSIRRAERYAENVAAAAQRLVAKGVPPVAVPDRLIRAVMEDSSVETDPTLRDAWVGLLTNAASGGAVPAVFPEILRQIEPIEARYLALLVEKQPQRSSRRVEVSCGESSESFVARTGGILIWRNLDNLERLALISYQLAFPPQDGLPELPLAIEGLVEVGASDLAREFVRACAP